MKKISDIGKVINVSNEIIENLVKGNLTYFNIIVADCTGFSQCFFTPTTEIKGEKGSMCFVGDYAKILMMLMTHPKVHDIEYDPKENMVSAIFDNPLQDEYEISQKLENAVR